MCWIGYKSQSIIRAQEDIEIFKIVTLGSNEIRSYFADYKYELGLLCPIINLELTSHGDFNYIERGYHGYNPVKVHVQVPPNHIPYVFIRTRNSQRFLGMYRRGICWVLECIIPKGSHYIENQNGCIVSSTILPIKLITIENYVLGK